MGHGQIRVHALLPVSIVIPTRDRPDLLRDTVQSILAGDRLPAEIVVADQSSVPGAPLPVAEGLGLVHLRLSSTGLSRARNAGIAAASHELVVITDDDVHVEPDWLRHLVVALVQAPARTVVTGRVRPYESDGHVPSVTYWTEPQVFEGRLFADVLFTNNMAIRRAAFEELGLFDERLGAGAEFPSAEDNDFGYRLLEAGYRIAFVPEAALWHRGARSGRRLAALDWAYGRGQGAFYAKHLTRSDRHMLRRFARNAAYRLRRMRSAIRGDRVALREGIYLAGLFWGAVGWRRRYGSGTHADGVPRLEPPPPP